MAYADRDTMTEAIRRRTEKRCRVCKAVKPLTEFHADASRPDGHEYRCAACSQIVRSAGFPRGADTPKKKRAPGGGRKPLSPGEVTRPRTVRLPPSWWDTLDGEAKERGITLSVYLRDIIRPHAVG